jgi:hypothetical protein
VFSIDAKQAVIDHFAGGARSVHSLAKIPGVAVVDTPDDWQDDVWINLNTPQDYQRFLQSSGVT